MDLQRSVAGIPRKEMLVSFSCVLFLASQAMNGKENKIDISHVSSVSFCWHYSWRDVLYFSLTGFPTWSVCMQILTTVLGTQTCQQVNSLTGYQKL